MATSNKASSNNSESLSKDPSQEDPIEYDDSAFNDSEGELKGVESDAQVESRRTLADQQARLAENDDDDDDDEVPETPAVIQDRQRLEDQAAGQERLAQQKKDADEARERELNPEKRRADEQKAREEEQRSHEEWQKSRDGSRSSQK